MIKIPGDVCDTYAIILDKDMFKKGINFPFGDPDLTEQHYFIEIISLDLSAQSVKFGVDMENGLLEVEQMKSPSIIQKSKVVEKASSTCICQEQYKDLIWGAKVSCEFRKKVVQICAELWGESRKMDMANGLMAVMSVETSGSFKAHQLEGWNSVKDPKEMSIKDFWKNNDSKTSRAIGLIQFTQEALESMGEFPKSTSLTKGTQIRYDALNKLKLSFAQMGEIKQLDKVKKYFEAQKSRIKSPEDIYLAVFAPIGIGKSDDSVLYKSGTDYYKANESVDTKSKGPNKADGKIQRSEILERYHKSKKDGLGYKTSNFTCGIDNKKQEDIKATDLVTYHIYFDGRIERHIPKK